MGLQVTAHGNRWASVGQTITVTVDDEALSLRAPFYRRTIPLRSITSAEALPDDGMNHGLVNWFVVGRASNPGGVRLNTGGKARVDLATSNGEHYAVVVDTMSQAEQIVSALRGGESS